MKRVASPVLLALLCTVALPQCACDPVGQPNARGSVSPMVAPAKLSPVSLLPAVVDRSVVKRFAVVDPPAVISTQVDVLRQVDGVVDILWVIDDSGSMANQRRTLAANFDSFLNALLRLKVDFHIAVTSTNPADAGRIRGTTPVIDSMTPNPLKVFEDNTTFAASRARWEHGLRMAQLAITPPQTSVGGPNFGFLRPGAALAIIVVTDEDDGSYGPTDLYVRSFRSAKGPGNENLVSFSTIGGTLPTGCTPAGEEQYFGSAAKAAVRYSEVSTKTGGIVGSICDQSFEDTLLEIASALNTLRRSFPLTLKPAAGSIVVTVNGVQVPANAGSGWQYRADTNSISFLGSFVPPPGATVRLEYAYDSP